jgi:hypothetical protein
MLKRKIQDYKGNLNQLQNKKIYINIKHLEKGDYELNIVFKNKIIIKTNFKK